ncbi:isoflavone reductase family protein CipA [Thozetella sp. PMI_491]|nr:isoflavone reductase family protein CipA [Thozetella sp. PMI_491]
MAKKITNVAVAGATGKVGMAVLAALLDRDFNVTALLRKPTDALPEGVNCKVIDFASEAAVVSALQGQDAVIDTTPPNIGAHVAANLISASVAAGVQRFIPSHFATNPDNAKTAVVPLFRDHKQPPYALVRKAAAESDLTYTLVACGTLINLALSSGIQGISAPHKKLKLFYGGTTVNSWTTLSAVGQATAEVLLHLDETRNRTVFVSSIVKSQLQVAELAKAALGSEGWQEEAADAGADYLAAVAAWETGQQDITIVRALIRHVTWSPEMMELPWPGNDNELLGVKAMDDGEVKALIKFLATLKNVPDLF